MRSFAAVLQASVAVAVGLVLASHEPHRRQDLAKKDRRNPSALLALANSQRSSGRDSRADRTASKASKSLVVTKTLPTQRRPSPGQSRLGNSSGSK